MADFGNPVVDPRGQDVTGNALKTLSGILGIKQQQAGIRSSEAEAQQQEQSASQRKNIAGYMQNFDPTANAGADGTLDLNKVISDPQLRQAAGDQFPELVGKMIQVKQGQLTAKQQLSTLNNDVRGQLFTTIGGLRTDPDVQADNEKGREKVHQAIGEFAALSPDAARVANIYSPGLDKLPKGKMTQALSNFQLQIMDAGGQAAHQAPAFTDVGGGLIQTNPQAAGGQLGGTLGFQKSIAPGIGVTTDAQGNPYAFNQQNPGRAVPIGQGVGLGGGGGGAAGGQAQAASGGAPMRPTRLIPGQQDIQADITNVRHGTQQIGTDRAVNNKILGLLGDTTTGVGSDIKAKLMSAAGLPGSSNLQELNAFLDRQAAAAGQAMGLPHTNAGLETSQQITGNISYDNKVIKDKTLFLDAMQAGAQAYRKGMDRVLGDPNNPNYGAYQDFRNQWAQTFKPEVFEWLNAKKRGDTHEIQRIEKDEGRKGMADLIQRGKVLQGLIYGQ